MSNIDKQALFEAAHRARWSNWEAYKPHKGDRGYEVKNGVEAVAQHCLKHEAEYIAAANPKVVLALLDELEAKDKSINFLKDQLAQLANFNPDWDKLEAATDSLREHMAELTAARKRIAELEAREVKFTLRPELTAEDCDILARSIDYGTGWNLALSSCEEEFIRALTSAGISINGEG